MNKKELLKEWLGNRERTYAGGIALFDALARPIHIEKYGAYFAQLSSAATFDPHFTQLIDVLSRISVQIDGEPHLYPAALVEEPIAETVPPKVLDEKQINDLVADKQQKIEELQSLVDGLTDKLDDLNNDQDDHGMEIGDLQEQLSQHETSIQTLQGEVEELMKPGIKVVVEADMPKTIREAYARIKEIVPLYASLHNDITNESITDEERKKFANNLCLLDDERRKLWEKINAWSEGKVLQVDEKKPEYSDNPTVRGFELLRARKRLKENIINSQKAAARAQADGKLTVYENAIKRVSRYELDLQEVETEIANAGLTD